MLWILVHSLDQCQAKIIELWLELKPEITYLHPWYAGYTVSRDAVVVGESSIIYFFVRFVFDYIGLPLYCLFPGQMSSFNEV